MLSKDVVWAAILSLVLGHTAGPDPSPPLSKRPDQYPVFYPPRRTRFSTFVSTLILGSGNYINPRAETAVVHGVYRPTSPLEYVLHFSMIEVLPALSASYFFMKCCVTSVCVSLLSHIELFGGLKRASRGMMVLSSINVPPSSRNPSSFGYKLAPSLCKRILRVILNLCRTSRPKVWDQGCVVGDSISFSP
jgi:hypothetical protein